MGSRSTFPVNFPPGNPGPPLPRAAHGNAARKQSGHVPPTELKPGDSDSSQSPSLPERLQELVDGAPSWMLSFCTHALLLILLALFLLPIDPDRDPLIISLGEQGEQGAEDEGFEQVVISPDDEDEPSEDDAEQQQEVEEQPAEKPEEAATAPVPAETAPTNPLPAGAKQQGMRGGAALPGGLAGRTGRRGHALAMGASEQSEGAVDLALSWLSRHQRSDGTWAFDLTACGCNKRCRSPGSGSAAINGATAIALLPFLGAGQTHEKGIYRANVAGGLQALLDRQDRDGSFMELQGRMYSHGLCTLVLCEALAMASKGPDATPKKRGSIVIPNSKLRRAAQEAIDFIVKAQHRGGGWRYEPKQLGDTSVVVWQTMALKSGQMAGLRVANRPVQRVNLFLDSVQVDEYGALYGYVNNRAERPATTAAGLLCRMYLGRGQGDPAILNGVDYLMEQGPSSNNVYYNYYATQVLHHAGGSAWEKWNSLLRDYLVEQQVTAGHAAGSWYFAGDAGSGIGGRLYITAMSTMILEVYYRHMPIYSDAVIIPDSLVP